jgi:hypothetical protein
VKTKAFCLVIMVTTGADAWLGNHRRIHLAVICRRKHSAVGDSARYGPLMASPESPVRCNWYCCFLLTCRCVRPVVKMFGVRRVHVCSCKNVLTEV